MTQDELKQAVAEAALAYVVEGKIVGVGTAPDGFSATRIIDAGGLVVDVTGVSGIRELDLAHGIVTADAGTSLDDLMRWLVPLGWFVPVTPGTRQVTVGGAIASDIHGKNHHKAGSWCDAVEAITLVTPTGGLVPLSSIARFETTLAPLSVSHQGGSAAATISFALPEGRSIGEATAAIDAALSGIGVPVGIRTSFEGSAGAFQKSMSTQPLLILAALVTIYIVLGILYESLIHPITILSTLPSAGVGALLALMAVDMEFSLIAMIGVILLIGIVKKNAIMMIDVAIARMRHQGENARDAIHHACLLRFRPILMTTLAALFGAIPLAIGSGDGAELRQPLGIAIVGGLILSQILTLYTTPVVFVMLDRLRRKRSLPAHA